MPAWRVRVMPVSGAHTAWLHEMLQAAVHSIYSRLGIGADVEVALRRRSDPAPSGSFSGQSPQKLEPPWLISARSCEATGPVQMPAIDEVRASPSTRLA